MKIFIATDTAELNGMVSKRFGHANFYIIYDIESNNYDIITNADHDEKNTVLSSATNNGINTFIVGNVGPHAFGIINTPNSKVYLARKMTAEEAINKLVNNELELLTDSTVKKSMHKH